MGGPWAEKHVPAHVRHMLMCESGCNDGAAFPFLYLALYLTQNRDNTGHAIAQWFYETWAYEIILGTLLGALIGYLARKFMRFSERRKLIDRESFVAQYISLAIASMGVNVLLGSDDLLAAFACGTAFAWTLVHQADRRLELLQHRRSALQHRHLHLHRRSDSVA